MVLKDELNIPYEDAALLIEHLEQVCNKAEVITKRMERNVQEIKLSIEIERNMLALAQREEQEMCGSHTLQLVEKLYDNIKNTTLGLYAMCLFKPDVDLLSDPKNKFYDRCLSTVSPDFGVHVRLEPSAIYVKLPLLWSRRNKSHKDMKSTAFERVTFFRDEINSSIKTAEGFDEYDFRKFSTKIVHFMYVYSENPSEKRFIADNDNHETKYVQDAITMFLPNGDSPFCCSTYSSAIMTNEIAEGTYLTITTEENGILPSEMIVDYWNKCP